MVRKFLLLFDRELGGLHQAAFFLALFALLSKVLALLRDRFLASTFGADRALDVYYASFIIPDYFYNFLLLIISASALIPLFLEKKSHSLEQGRRFLNEVLSAFLLIAFPLSVALFFLIPHLAPLVAPGFSTGEKSQLVTLSRILLLSPFLLGLSSLLSSAVQSLRKFFVYALAPVFYNLGIICGILFFFRWWGLKGVVFGVALGAFSHFFIQVPSLLKNNFLPRVTLKIKLEEIKRIIILSFPRSLGLTLNQFVLSAITAFASIVGPGSIAIFNLSVNLQNIPLTVIGVSYSVAAFPTLAQFYVKNEKKQFLEHIIAAGRHIIFWSFPVSVLFIVLRAQIVRVVLGAGAFTWADTRLTAASLGLLSLAIAAQGLMFLLTRSFYAAGRTKTPLIINFLCSLITIIGSFSLLWAIAKFEEIRLFLSGLLRVSDVGGVEMLGLPLIFSLGTILNTVFLWIFFQKEFGGLYQGVKKTIIHVICSSVVMGVVVYFSLTAFAAIFNIRTFIGIFLQGLVSGILGIGLGVAVLFFIKNQELREIMVSLRRKISRKQIVLITSEPENLSR